MKLTEEEKQILLDACVSDSAKVIQYLKEQEQKQKPYNTTMLILTIISAVCAVIAAIVGIIACLQ